MKVAQSHHIYTHDYDPESQTMTVQFLNGSVYQYAGVPQTTYDTFQQSSSLGSYLHAKIIPYFSSQMVTGGARGFRRRRR